MTKPYYQDDFATLYFGDCLEFIPELEKVDAIVTDPPYLMGSASTRQGKGFRSKVGDWTNASLWYAAWMKGAWELLNETGSMWICGNWRTMPVLTIAADSFGVSPSSVVVWDKNWIGVGSLKGLRQRYELVFQFGKPEFGIENRSEPDIWTIPWASQRPHGHDAEKPEGLMEKAITLSEAKIILDPFAGSGTTLQAAKNLGVKSIGIEIDEHYCETIAKRLQQPVTPNLFTLE